MEHRLIQGGEQFLPFARSCITKLKRLGLPYASQSFEIDGASIKVRVEPGHEYIRIEGGGTAYMESGQLEWTFPGLENPTRADPATWNFAGIPLDSKYLGWASTERGKKNGEQKNKLALTGGMDSKAIGPPVKIAPPGADAETIATINALNAEKKLSYADAVVMRKLVAAFYPPSLFSGKMRLFMQAQYGATQNEDLFPFFLEVSGTTVILKYRQIDGTASDLQFGLYESSSPGIYRAPLPPEGDGSYWLVNITKQSSYTVTAYPLKISNKTAGMLAHMHSTKSSSEDKAKCEAYVLANAIILVDEPKVIHHFTGAVGDAFAYGWKFNSTGSEASVVVHGVNGEGFSNDWSWSSYTMRLTIGVAPDPDTGEYNFAVTDTTTPHGEWTDGWGYWNFFVPTIESGGPIELKSLKTNAVGVRNDFNFTDVPVYGYYVNDVWTPVLVSRDIGTPDAPLVFTNSTSGPVQYGDGVSGSDQAYQRGVIPATGSVNYEQKYKGNTKTMDVSFGGVTYHGETSDATHLDYTRVAEGGSGSTVPGPLHGMSIDMGWYGVPVTHPAGYGSDGEVEGAVTTFVSNITTTLHTYNISERNVWALVIPPGDCEAIYIATQEYTADLINEVFVRTTGTMVTHFSGTYRIFGAGLEQFSYEPWTQANTFNSDAYRHLPIPAVVSTYDPPIGDPGIIKVFCHNAAMSGTQGTPSGSYFSLFNVDRNYPYFNGAMYAFVSVGKRFVLSEVAVNSPPDINQLGRFVGWA